MCFWRRETKNVKCATLEAINDYKFYKISANIFYTFFNEFDA